MRYLLDTCVVSETIRPRPSPRVTAWLDAQDELTLFLSVVVIGELHKGVGKLPASARRRHLQAWIDGNLTTRFAGRVLTVDQAVAARWGTLCGEAERAGQKLPVLDAMLAATALEHGMTLVTRNLDHFQRTGVLLIDPWHD
ncbi:MAG: PIN domain-containing protein [Candidatus Xenobia bacterium]